MKKVRILNPWICGGRNPAIGSEIELEDCLADSGVERGLCEIIDGATVKKSASSKRGSRKRKTS